MQQSNLSTKWEGGGKTVTINVSVVTFEEDNIQYSFIPSFDLIGYGKTESEAEASLKIVLDEFLRYTINKNTLTLELKRLGWKIKSKHKPMMAPQLSDLVNTNDQLKDIFNNKPFSTSNYEVKLPAFA